MSIAAAINPVPTARRMTRRESSMAVAPYIEWMGVTGMALTPDSKAQPTTPDSRMARVARYCRAIAMRMASSGATICPSVSAASAMAIWTPLTRPLNALSPGR
jgi:hypothetical protein